MKKLLWLTNLFLFMSSFLACPGVRKVQEENKTDITTGTPDSVSVDSLKMVMDPVSADTLKKAGDTLSKEEKYAKGSGAKREAPDHRTPDDAKLDSIKQEKAKGKKKN